MKEKIDLEQIKHIAKLANLPLTESELKKFAMQVSEIVEFNISHIEKIVTKNIQATSHALGVKNRVRIDETRPGFDTKEALQNAKATHQSFFKVKAILDFSADKESE